jgi:hypothetical protein
MRSWRLAALSLTLAVPATTAIHAQTPGQKSAPAAGAQTGKATAASTVKKVVPKRLPWGDPDISGNFTDINEVNTPMERPDAFAGKTINDVTPPELAALVKQRQRNALAGDAFAGGGSRSRGIAIGVPIHWLDNLDAENSRPWFVIDPSDGKIPPQTDEARKRAAELVAARLRRGTADSYTDRSLPDRCITYPGPAVANMAPKIYGDSYQILQTKDYVAIRYEMIHETRIIPIEGRASARPHNSAEMRAYYGDATGRWEGDTFVVDSTNFHPKTNYRGSSTTLHTIERFRRTAQSKVEWTATIEDPHTWARAWTFSIPLTEDDGQPIFEYACHEGNYGLRNILSAGRSDDRKGIKSSNNADEQGDLLKSEIEE